MKRNILLITALLQVLLTSGQVKHSISLSTNLYANFFNREKDHILPIAFYSRDGILPELSYKIERGKNGLELSYSMYSRHYPDTYNGRYDVFRVENVYFSTVVLNYHYRFYKNRFIELNAMGGATYGKYSWGISDYWWGELRRDEWDAYSPALGHNSLGLQTGLNTKVFIWKGIYANSNIRFNTIPWAKNPFYQNSLLFNIGLGYQFGRNK